MECGVKVSFCRVWSVECGVRGIGPRSRNLEKMHSQGEMKSGRNVIMLSGESVESVGSMTGVIINKKTVYVTR